MKPISLELFEFKQKDTSKYHCLLLQLGWCWSHILSLTCFFCKLSSWPKHSKEVKILSSVPLYCLRLSWCEILNCFKCLHVHKSSQVVLVKTCRKLKTCKTFSNFLKLSNFSLKDPLDTPWLMFSGHSFSHQEQWRSRWRWVNQLCRPTWSGHLFYSLFLSLDVYYICWILIVVQVSLVC